MHCYTSSHRELLYCVGLWQWSPYPLDKWHFGLHHSKIKGLRRLWNDSTVPLFEHLKYLDVIYSPLYPEFWGSFRFSLTKRSFCIGCARLFTFLWMCYSFIDGSFWSVNGKTEHLSRLLKITEGQRWATCSVLMHFPSW